VLLAASVNELANPLAPVIKARHQLRQSGFPHEKLDGLQRPAERHATRLSHFNNGLFDLSRINPRKMTLHMEVFSIWSAIDRAIEVNAAAASQLGYELEVTGARAATLFVRGGPSRITQALVKLPADAVRFAGDGVKSSSPLPMTMATSTIAIVDKGTVMSATAVPSLFETLEAAYWMFRTGLSIGVSVARARTIMHPGPVTASSDRTKKAPASSSGYQFLTHPRVLRTTPPLP
jgi:K+-sensing histidine kinase KdpD